MPTSKLAIWSFWLIIFAYFLIGIFYIVPFNPLGSYGDFMFVFLHIAGLISIITFILGIISLRKIKKKKLKGKGFAIATIILSLIIIGFFLWSYYWIYQLAKINFD